MESVSRLHHTSAAYIAALYEQYQQDHDAVDPSWQQFFMGYEFAGGGRNGEATVVSMGDKEVAVMKLINAYRERGHLVADFNPIRARRFHKADLDLEYFGLTDDDLDTVFEVGSQVHIGPAPLRQILAHLNATYCGPVGVEFRHIPDSQVRIWLHEAMEPVANRPNFSPEERRRILSKLNAACGFEKFLHTKFTGQKRFSLEGCESLIPALDGLFRAGVHLGVREYVLGMAHRGRLNVLVNCFEKSYEAMFSEFEGGVLPDYVHGEGDVKYHQGQSADITLDGQPLHLSLAPNPSHLEAVDPVVEGMVRAKGEHLYGGDFSRIAPILIHGDAAVAGQGVVYEVANMSGLEGYATGGTVHIVLNNLIGFTATGRETRSSTYATDIAKVIQSPVFHVNADDPEAVTYVVRLAIEFRQLFHRDVFIDIVGYRRYGHNEGDDPSFTNPLLYKAISQHPVVLDIYTQYLIDEGVITEDETEELVQAHRRQLQESLEQVREQTPNLAVDWLKRQWAGFRPSQPEDFAQSPETGVGLKSLLRIGDALIKLPEDFNLYPRAKRLLRQRRELLEEDGAADWGLAEQLAYGSLLAEGVPVRLSGQDCRRGTFAHRHAVFFDYQDETAYVPLNHIQRRQAELQVWNSHLSEFAVLGFEYGYSASLPRSLVVWEAQFGDFANGAQTVIDQFIASAESKWQRMSGLCLFLPHGYEGQGPEHSSARLNRFLALCAENNLVVCNVTTPANLFHLLRRQIHVPYRKPLVLLSPKAYLRHPDVRSPLTELSKGRFQEVLDDPDVTDPARIERVLVCSGKLFWQLRQHRADGHHEEVAVVRLEQHYPTPREAMHRVLDRYTNAKDVVWVQEEPINMGAWYFVNRWLARDGLRVLSRPESASPATGSLKRHLGSQARLIDEAFK